jgi:hypothetical protein
MSRGPHVRFAQLRQLRSPRQIAPCSRASDLLARLRDRVAFFDFLLGQTGVAPNAIELHPILSFGCLQ